jgi:hypothetical protein
MQAEMNKLFAEGGVMQEGGTVDPVSGNEVPPGAMAEEVRDDIDAKLSEGEFVFPADVVRFYGLEKLMMMRDKAKKGLQRMNEIGQMGNAEEVPDGEALFGGGEDEMDDDTFSSEIDSIMSEDEGGETREYAEGGYVLPENEQLYRDAPVKGFEMVPMTNDAGQTIYIPFINGVAQLSIPSGYKVKAAGATEPTAPVAAGPTTQTTPSGGDAGGSDGGGPVGGGGGSFGTDAPNPSSTHGGITAGSPVASTLGGIVGGLFGLSVGMPSLGVQAGKSLASSLSNSQAQAQTAEAIGFNLGVEGYSSQAVTAAQQAAQNASTQANATAGSIAAAGAQAAADVDGKDPMEAMMAVTNAFGTGTSGTSVSEGENPSGGTNVTGTVNGETFGYTEAAPSTNTSTESSFGFGTSGTDTGADGIGGVGTGASDGSGSGAGAGTGGASAGDSGDGGVGAASAGDGWAKGGFVPNRKNKKTGKSTSFVTRQK